MSALTALVTDAAIPAMQVAELKLFFLSGVIKNHPPHHKRSDRLSQSLLSPTHRREKRKTLQRICFRASVERAFAFFG